MYFYITLLNQCKRYFKTFKLSVILECSSESRFTPFPRGKI